jgi:hypothetical protein
LSVIAVGVTPVKVRLVGAVGITGVKEKILLEPFAAELRTVIVPAV